MIPLSCSLLVLQLLYTRCHRDDEHGILRLRPVHAITRCCIARQNTLWFRAYRNLYSFVYGCGTLSRWIRCIVLCSGARVRYMCHNNVYCNRCNWCKGRFNDGFPLNITHQRFRYAYLTFGNRFYLKLIHFMGYRHDANTLYRNMGTSTKRVTHRGRMAYSDICIYMHIDSDNGFSPVSR